MAIEDSTDVPVGTKVFVEHHEHAFGNCFLTGNGEVVENRDYISRTRGDVKVRFENVTGIFNTSHYGYITVVE